MAALTRFIPVRISDSVIGNISGRSFLGVVGNVELSRRWEGTKSQLEKVDDLGLITQQDSVDEETLRKIRNISRLRPADRNRVFNLMPYEEPTLPAHYTVRYNRRMLGRYGSVSGVNPGICWPTKDDLEDMKEYERVAYPYTIPEVAEREAAKEAAAEKARRDWDEEVAAKVAKLPALREKLMDVQAEAARQKAQAQERRRRLIDAVNQHFNYSVATKDGRFRDEMKRREKEMKEKERLAKKAAKLEQKEKYKEGIRRKNEAAGFVATITEKTVEVETVEAEEGDKPK